MCRVFALHTCQYSRCGVVQEWELEQTKLEKVAKCSLVPRPCAFVACSTKFAQRAWARSSRDVCHSRIFTSPDAVLLIYMYNGVSS